MAPHITIGKKIFDLEFEQDSNTEQSLAKVFRILLGEKVEDKHGNMLQLKSGADKIKFLNALTKNYQFNVMIRENNIMKKSELREIIKEEIQKLNEKDMTGMKYAVVLKGGSIGEKNIRSLRDLKGQKVVDTKRVYDSYEEAVKSKKSYNKMLSPGEKQYYGLLYIVAGVQDGIFTGKGK